MITDAMLRDIFAPEKVQEAARRVREMNALDQTPLSEGKSFVAYLEHGELINAVPLDDCQEIERRLNRCVAALRAADDDIRELLQVAKYNLYGETPAGDILGPPAEPMLVHEHGIRASMLTREVIRQAILDAGEDLGENPT